jgi:hypothetical protein
LADDRQLSEAQWARISAPQVRLIAGVFLVLGLVAGVGVGWFLSPTAEPAPCPDCSEPSPEITEFIQTNIDTANAEVEAQGLENIRVLDLYPAVVYIAQSGNWCAYLVAHIVDGEGYGTRISDYYEC